MTRKLAKIEPNAEIVEQNLVNELSALIEKSKRSVGMYANAMTALVFWQIGKRINDIILQNKRAEYGKQIVVTVSRQLQERHGRSFEEKNLRRMMQFAEQFTDKQIVVTLSRQLSWSHFVVLITLKSDAEKQFYIKESIANYYGVRELRKQIELKAYERNKIADTQISKSAIIPQNTFKDPYIFDFLELKNAYSENDLETAIIRELESFILEFGKGFAFVERQKRMIIDGEDFYLDLLFYHRTLKRLVAVELKIGKFQAKFKGQMELYLKWLNRYEKQDGENMPIGLILCTEGNREQIELLEMHKDGIMVAEYLTQLPPKKEFEKKIHSLLLEAREKLEKRQLIDRRG